MPERASPADRRGVPLRARTRSRSPNPRSTERPGPRRVEHRHAGVTGHSRRIATRSCRTTVVPRGPRHAPVVIWRRLAASRSKASPSAPADARCPNAASARERESRRLSARRDGINVHMLPPDRRGRASWRGAGVAERGGLENRCTLCGVPWVRIPPPPPLCAVNALNWLHIKQHAVIYPCYYPGSRRGFRRTAADRMTTREPALPVREDCASL